MTDSQTRTSKQTRRWVLIADRIADRTITVGGILVIAAVLGMMVFLVYEVSPLFKGGVVEGHAAYRIPGQAGPVAGLAIDEYKTVGTSVSRDGNVESWHLKTGDRLVPPAFDFRGKQVTAFAKAGDDFDLVFGFADGTARFAKIVFNAEILPEDVIPAGATVLANGDRTDGQAIFTVIGDGQVRKVSVGLDLTDEIRVSDAAIPIVAMGYRLTDMGERPIRRLVSVDAAGNASLNIAESKLNLFTRKLTTKVSTTGLPRLPEGVDIKYALLNGVGDQVYLAQGDGKVYRYNTRDPDKPELAEMVQVTPDGVGLTTLGFLMGDLSFVVGGSDGSLNIYFLLSRPDAKSPDGQTLVKARTFEPHGSAVTAFSASQRGKTFATGDAGGEVLLRHGTSQKTLLKLRSTETKGPVTALAVTPRMDGVLSVGRDGRAQVWDVDVPHPETSLHTLFGKVWYEGYPGPSYTWQSTGGTDAFEPKLSLIPLIFGTLKATFYSLMFAIPIALLAAVYTSEFLSNRLRGQVKPVMEIMASLPSVVLGFVAALVLAPIVENWVAAIILAFVVMPACLVLAAYLWQLLPVTVSLRLEGIPKFLMMFVVVAAALYLTYRIGPLFEKLFFGGDFRAWLNEGSESAVPFMFLLTLPLAALAVGIAASRLLGKRLKEIARRVRPSYAGLLDLARLVVMTAVTLVLAYAGAAFWALVGLDPRDGLVGTYVQRNTLIIGFAMGFAVIPIIYTLAEDALNSVPDHLRSASLGCGATPWQTAMWIVLPAALSGVFSAVMIGMGRAVGETMIVVMAAGNTPLIDMNIFNGLRALSANIAVELPEAPKDGTLYRVLFMTGLVLFGMTFVINTVAELVRLRFRKRATQL